MEHFSTEVQASEYPRWRQVWNWIALRIWHWRLRCWIPRLVWIGDEIDVRVTLSEDKLKQENPLENFQSGSFRQIENQLRLLGIEFDTGQGCAGRDWEWDWSLKGPIHISFVGRAKKPERRE